MIEELAQSVSEIVGGYALSVAFVILLATKAAKEIDQSLRSESKLIAKDYLFERKIFGIVNGYNQIILMIFISLFSVYRFPFPRLLRSSLVSICVYMSSLLFCVWYFQLSDLYIEIFNVTMSLCDVRSRNAIVLNIIFTVFISLIISIFVDYFVYAKNLFIYERIIYYNSTIKILKYSIFDIFSSVFTFIFVCQLFLSIGNISSIYQISAFCLNDDYSKLDRAYVYFLIPQFFAIFFINISGFLVPALSIISRIAYRIDIIRDLASVHLDVDKNPFTIFTRMITIIFIIANVFILMINALLLNF